MAMLNHQRVPMLSCDFMEGVGVSPATKKGCRFVLIGQKTWDWGFFPNQNGGGGPHIIQVAGQTTHGECSRVESGKVSNKIVIRLYTWCYLPSGKQTWLLKMAIYSGFTHLKWWFSIVMLVHQRVNINKWAPCRPSHEGSGGIFVPEVHGAGCRCQVATFGAELHVSVDR